VSAAPPALWRYVQWLLATATSPQVRLFAKASFRIPETSRWIDVDLPTGATSAPDPSLRRVPVVTAMLFRENLEKDEGQHFTRVRLERAFREVTERLEAQVPDRDRAQADPLTLGSIALPRSGSPPETRIDALRQLEGQLADLVRGHPTWVGEVKTPYPKGLAVPSGDVIAVLDLFQRLGAGRIWIESPPPPKLKREGAGWDWK
jgi:hypothetical protein